MDMSVWATLLSAPIRKYSDVIIPAQREMKKEPFIGKIIGCAIEVHCVLGPGLLESTYQQCLARELHLKGLKYNSPCPLCSLWFIYKLTS